MKILKVENSLPGLASGLREFMDKISAGKSKERAGFTLIEIIIVFSIVGVLMTGLTLYSRKSEKLLLLFKEQARIVGALQKAKSLAMGAYGQQNAPCGYGVHFNAAPVNTFVIFRDLGQTGQPCSSFADKVLTAGNSSEIVETLALDRFLAFGALPAADVVFIPPEPETVLDNDLNEEEAIISVVIPATADSRRVKITNSGQITALSN